MTFSIAARCPSTGMLGVAVASASLASGAWTPSVKTATGAIASQAFGNPFFGIDSLRLLAFVQSSDQELSERLVRALEAGDAAGGDRRGRQSAGLIVCYDQDYRYYDHRVDDHPDPVSELRRLFELRKAARMKHGGWRPTREDLLAPGFIQRYEREAAAVEA